MVGFLVGVIRPTSGLAVAGRIGNIGCVGLGGLGRRGAQLCASTYTMLLGLVVGSWLVGRVGAVAWLWLVRRVGFRAVLVRSWPGLGLVGRVGNVGWVGLVRRPGSVAVLSGLTLHRLRRRWALASVLVWGEVGRSLGRCGWPTCWWASCGLLGTSIGLDLIWWIISSNRLFISSSGVGWWAAWWSALSTCWGWSPCASSLWPGRWGLSSWVGCWATWWSALTTCWGVSPCAGGLLPTSWCWGCSFWGVWAGGHFWAAWWSASWGSWLSTDWAASLWSSPGWWGLSSPGGCASLLGWPGILGDKIWSLLLWSWTETHLQSTLVIVRGCIVFAGLFVLVMLAGRYLASSAAAWWSGCLSGPGTSPGTSAWVLAGCLSMNNHL